jgi:hypothetical protein
MNRPTEARLGQARVVPLFFVWVLSRACSPSHTTARGAKLDRQPTEAVASCDGRQQRIDRRSFLHDFALLT